MRNPKLKVNTNNKECRGRRYIEKPPENPRANLSLLGVPHGWQFRRAIKEKYICQGASRGNSGVPFPLVFDNIIIPHASVSFYVILKFSRAFEWIL